MTLHPNQIRHKYDNELRSIVPSEEGCNCCGNHEGAFFTPKLHPLEGKAFCQDCAEKVGDAIQENERIDEDYFRRLCEDNN